MHSFDICFDIASKMKNPRALFDFMNEKINKGQIDSLEWPTISLAWGISGIISFYAAMDFHFPKQEWEKVVYDYLTIAKDKINNCDSDFSLFTGLTGINTAVYFCSQNGQRYQKMLTALDDVLIRELPVMYLSLADRYCDPKVPVPPDYYNLTHGMSGILMYLMHREDHIAFRSLAHQFLDSLIKIFSGFKDFKGSKIPAWYVCSEHECNSKFKDMHPDGTFKLDIPNGMSGVLLTLSLAKMKGFNVVGLDEIITKISEWIMDKKIIHDQLICWNHFVQIEEELEGVTRNLKSHYRSWFYGSVGILRALYLAARANRNTNLEKISEEAFFSHLEFPNQEKMIDISLSSGKAGLLTLCYEMANDTKNLKMFNFVKLLEEDIKNDYHPNHEFGFQTLLYHEKTEPLWSHSPNLINGSSGIALTLLQVEGKQEMNFNKWFAIA